MRGWRNKARGSAGSSCPKPLRTSVDFFPPKLTHNSVRKWYTVVLMVWVVIRSNPEKKLAIYIQAYIGRSETGTGRARPVPQKKLPHSPGRTYRHDARLAVLEVQVGGGLVQRQDAALVAEGTSLPHSPGRTYRHDARLAVLEVQVGGGLVQRQDAALVAEGTSLPHSPGRTYRHASRLAVLEVQVGGGLTRGGGGRFRLGGAGSGSWGARSARSPCRL